MLNILLTAFVGLFIILGTLIVLFTKNNDKVVSFSLSCALGSICSLVIAELIPESYENMSYGFSAIKSVLIMVILAVIGIYIIKILDDRIPEHDHKDCVHSNSSHYFHIGYMTSIALVLHNIIEGMAVYISFDSSLSLGIMVGLGVALHNIPMGMEIGSMFYKYYKNNIRVLIISLLVSLSTALGGLFVYLIGKNLDKFMVGSLLSLTLGMLVYIVFWELIPHIKQIKEKKLVLCGIFTGIVLFVLSRFLE